MKSILSSESELPVSRASFASTLPVNLTAGFAPTLLVSLTAGIAPTLLASPQQAFIAKSTNNPCSRLRALLLLTNVAPLLVPPPARALPWLRQPLFFPSPGSALPPQRSAARRRGKEGVSTCRYRWSQIL